MKWISSVLLLCLSTAAFGQSTELDPRYYPPKLQISQTPKAKYTCFLFRRCSSGMEWRLYIIEQMLKDQKTQAMLDALMNRVMERVDQNQSQPVQFVERGQSQPVIVVIPTPQQLQATPIPTPNQVVATPIPAPQQIIATPIPAPAQIQATPIPTPQQVAPTPAPQPNQVNPTPVPQNTLILPTRPIGTQQRKHVPWPQVYTIQLTRTPWRPVKK